MTFDKKFIKKSLLLVVVLILLIEIIKRKAWNSIIYARLLLLQKQVI